MTFVAIQIYRRRKMSLNYKPSLLLFLILVAIVPAGCIGEKAPPPNYSATETETSRSYRTQAAESLVRATTSAPDSITTDNETIPVTSCVITAIVVGGIIFLFSQSRRNRRR
jgi:hypothetical protein